MRILLLLGLIVACAHAEKMKIVRPLTYSGMADASGAVALTTNLFAVADDEDSVLRIYRNDQEGPPVKALDCEPFLKLIGEHRETDLEAGARLGDRVFWIGSHGRSKTGKERLNRGCFFATDIKMANGEPTLVPVGAPYKMLLDDLLADPRLARFGLAEASLRQPKEANAFNIEGLSATPQSQLLIGLRNPVPNGKALLIPLLNPEEIVQGSGTRARFGEAFQLDLGGLGIRDIALYQETFLIIAGPYHQGGKFQLYRWNGGTSEPTPITVKHLDRYHPEAIIIYPDKGLNEFQILSDDGNEPVDGVPGKQVQDHSRKQFRSFWVATDPKK